MSEVNFDVSTPLRENEWCQSPAEVRDEIAHYMNGDDASLGQVRVVEFSTRERTAVGRDRDPSDFWPDLS